jgi:hypothetical protein
MVFVACLDDQKSDGSVPYEMFSVPTRALNIFVHFLLHVMTQ